MVSIPIPGGQDAAPLSQVWSKTGEADMSKSYPVDMRDRYSYSLVRSIALSIGKQSEDIKKHWYQPVIEYELYEPKSKEKYYYKFTMTDPFSVADCILDYHFAKQKVGGAYWKIARCLNGELHEHTKQPS